MSDQILFTIKELTAMHAHMRPAASGSVGIGTDHDEFQKSGRGRTPNTQ